MRRTLSAFWGVIALLVAGAAPALPSPHPSLRAAFDDARLVDPSAKLGYPVLGSRPSAVDLETLYGEPDRVARELAPAVPAGFDPARWPRVARVPAWPWREVEVRYYGHVGFGVAGGEVVWVTNRSPREFRAPRPEPEALAKVARASASPYDGNWSEGSSGVSFTVVDGQIVDGGILDLNYAGCNDGGTIFSVFFQPITVEGNKFEFSLSGVTGDNIWIVTNEGTFESDSAASGDVSFLVLGDCGFLFGLGGFDAAKQPDYVLHVTPSFSRIFSGQSTSFDVVVDSLGGFNQPVAIDVTRPDPPGVTFSAFPQTIMPGSRATVDVSTDPDAASTGAPFLLESSTGRATHRTLGGVDVRLFLLTASPGLRVVTPGQSTTFTLLNESANFMQPATLSAEVFPATSNIQVRFGQPALAPGEQTTVTVTAASGTALDFYGITITGTAGVHEERAFLDLEVANGGFTVAVEPATVTVARGQKVPVTVTVERAGNFSGPVTVTAANGKTIKLKAKPGSVQVSGASATFTIKAKPTATPGRYELVFTGRAGDERRTARLIVEVE
jgi:hypothetical protein